LSGAAKKTNPLIWILVGILGLFMLVGIVVVAGGIFVAKKVQDAAANPALAAAELIAAANPDVEIVSSDEGAGTVTFKDTTTGKVVTVDLDQIKEGKLTVKGDGDGETVTIGADASTKLPEWLPVYPGATTSGTFAMQGSNSAAATVGLTTSDSVENVAKFYEETFKKAGLSTTTNLMQQDGKNSGGMIAGESADKKRSAVVSMATGDEGLTVGITYSDKRD
jgi:hypothetical protein